MKTGRTLQDLAAELARQHDTRRDYVAPTQKLALEAVDARPQEDGEAPRDVPRTVALAGINGSMPINGYAHSQIAGDVGIPKPYYDRMLRESPELLARNVNHWFQAAPQSRLVRTLDSRVRAFLSDRYGIIELTGRALRTLAERGDVLTIDAAPEQSRRQRQKHRSWALAPQALEWTRAVRQMAK